MPCVKSVSSSQPHAPKAATLLIPTLDTVRKVAGTLVRLMGSDAVDCLPVAATKGTLLLSELAGVGVNDVVKTLETGHELVVAVEGTELLIIGLAWVLVLLELLEVTEAGKNTPPCVVGVSLL